MKEIIDRYNKMSLSELEQEFFKACEYNDIHIVQLLLNSRKLTQRVAIDAGNNLGFIKACQSNNVGIVRYLLTSKNLTKHANMFEPDNHGFRAACSSGALEVVQYLLSSSELKEHVSLTKDKEQGLGNAINSRSIPLIKYLIFDCNADLSEELIEYIQRLSIKKEIMDIVAKRDLKESLKKDLLLNHITEVKKKL